MLMTIETSRLVLKILHKDAAPMVLSFYENNKTSFEPWEPKRSANFYTLSYQKASLTSEYYQMLEGKLLRYWVFLKDNPDDIIGSICFQNFLKAPYYSCSLGYKFSETYWHQGYAYESINKALDLLYDEYPIHRIDAYIMPNNLPSIKLIKKLKFIYEGTSYSYANIYGTWEDHKRFARINPRDLNIGSL